MKKYFCKYLPVEGEIKKRTGTTVSNEVGKCLRESDDGYDYYQKVKLFLCSRDIDLPCPKCKSDNGHGNYDYSKPDKPLIDILCNECGEVYEPIKVIGEISPEATWVREGDEFDENELEFYGPETDPEEWCREDWGKIIVYNPNNPTVKIKGPCGHFH